MKLFKVIALSLSFLCASVSAQNISIATGGTGGVYYPMGGGLASVLSSKVPGMSATAEVTGGSVDNLNLIGTGKPYVGFSMADAERFFSLDGRVNSTDTKIDQIIELLVQVGGSKAHLAAAPMVTAGARSPFFSA